MTTPPQYPPDPFEDVPPTYPPDPFDSVPPPGMLPEGGEEGGRSSSARERQERRKRQGLAPTSTHKAPRQTARPSRIQAPKIHLPFGGRALAVAGALLLVVIVVVVLGRLRPTVVEAGPNAIWAGTEWTYDAPDDAAVAAFAERLKANGIGTVYAWVSWFQEDGNWRGTLNFPNVKHFVEQMRAAYPEATLYGWVSLPVQGGPDGYRLDDEGVAQAFADFSVRVVNDFGFDGVFLNVEPVWTGDESFLTLLRGVRSAIGIDPLLSVAAPPDWSPLDPAVPVPPLIVPGTIWEEEYKQSVALLSDELAVMAYNSGLSSPEDYSVWVAHQVVAFSTAIAALGEGTHLMIGVPSYDADLPGHDPLVENVTSAKAGIAQGLTDAGAAAEFVRGIALYAAWTTDEQEWAAFQAAFAE